jgi:hypothetical protein
LESYIQGRYFRSDEDLENFKKSAGEKILRELKKEYPFGLSVGELSERTDIPYTTINPYIGELARTLFIRQMKLKNDNRRKTSTRINEYAIEDVNKLSQLRFPYPHTTGNVEFSTRFKNAWYQLVGTDEEAKLHNDLVNFLNLVIRRVNDLDKPELRKLFPSSSKKEDFCCTNCGLNHEARDFVRATLLNLIDQFETSKYYLQLLRDNNYVRETHYGDYAL